MLLRLSLSLLFWHVVGGCVLNAVDEGPNGKERRLKIEAVK